MEVEIREDLEKTTSMVVCPIPQGGKELLHLKHLAERYGFDAALVHKDFEAESGKIQFVYLDKKGPSRLILLGLGDNLDYGNVIFCFRTLGAALKGHEAVQIGIDLISGWHDRTQISAILKPLASGFWLGFHQQANYKSKTDNPSSLGSLIVFIDQPASTWKDEVTMAVQLVETQSRVMELVNAPANKLTPRDLGHWASESGAKYGFQVQVMGRKEIKQEKLQALEAVSQGSNEEPAFIICQYNGNPSSKKVSIGLVGKGITFDTGGISIKPSANLEYMKSDMGGGAAVLGVIEIVAKLGLEINVVAVVPAAQNDVGSKAVKPGDVVGSFLGKTIEVINTDAEGRMILADGLTYINRRFDPEVLIDMATLTGSCVRAIGYEAGGLFSQNDQLKSQLEDSGNKVAERLWAFPMWDEYKKDLISDVADLRNVGPRPVADAILAAKFLEEFVEDHPRWAHLDIAGVAFGDSKFSKHKTGTGFGVGLILRFILDFVTKKS